MGYNSDSDKESKKVFISYAHEDRESALRFYKDLKDIGLEPWIDEESLLAGEVWREAISKAIKNSHYFIPILSSNSVERRGYVQKELKEALDILAEISYSKIFVIPVRLDACKVSDRKVNELHIVDLFPEWTRGFEKVLKAMGIENTKDTFNWTPLLYSISERKCTPFIGEEVCQPWISHSKEIASRWAKENDYPLQDSYQLSRVAQFLAIKNEDNNIPKEAIRREIKKAQVPNFSLGKFRNTPLAVLADLNLPIYITTNYDHFIEEALRSKGKVPISDFCRWNEDLKEYATDNEINSKLYDKDSGFEVTSANPLVYHLHGDIDHPESMVLTEKDYIEFILNLKRNDEKNIFPTIARPLLIPTSPLFIGYRFDDISFRIILNSLVSSLRIKFQLSNIAVMESSELIINNKINEAQKYMENYTKKILKMNPYWGNTIQFSEELRHQLDNFVG